MLVGRIVAPVAPGAFFGLGSVLAAQLVAPAAERAAARRGLRPLGPRATLARPTHPYRTVRKAA